MVLYHFTYKSQFPPPHIFVVLHILLLCVLKLLYYTFTFCLFKQDIILEDIKLRQSYNLLQLLPISQWPLSFIPWYIFSYKPLVNSYVNFLIVSDGRENLVFVTPTKPETSSSGYFGSATDVSNHYILEPLYFPV